MNPIQIELKPLIQLKAQARYLHLRQAHIKAKRSGQYLSRLRGRGMEFAESRPYQPGDEIRHIDWRVTARSGRTYTKLFQEERERPVLISVDDRSSMWFASRGRLKRVQAAELAALLAWAALQQGDNIGGEVFGDDDFKEVKPKRGKHSVLKLLHFIAQRPPQRPAQAQYISLLAPLQRLRRTAHPGSLVILISDFHGFDEQSQQQLLRIAEHNDVLLLHVYDPLEKELPYQPQAVVSDGRQRIRLNDRRLIQHYASQYQQRVQHLIQFCRQHHLSWLQCASDETAFQVLAQVFAR